MSECGIFDSDRLIGREPDRQRGRETATQRA